MLITRLRLKNWTNFRDVELALGPRGYVIGANASGKSNFLDVFRSLRTIAQDAGSELILEPGRNGTTVRTADAEEQAAMEHGLNAAEVLLPKTRPRDIAQMGRFA